MPLYDYVCAACGRRFEVIHGVHADSPASCPLCGKGPVRKAITAASVHYKGSGWAKKERRASVKSSASSRGGDEGSPDGASPDPGTSKDVGTSRESGSPTATPAAASTGDSAKDGSSKSGSSSKTPARTSD